MNMNSKIRRALSVMIVMMMLATPFFVLEGRTATNVENPGITADGIPLIIDPAHSPFIIDENTIDPITGQKGMYGQDGNITVQAGGIFIVRNATLYFLQDDGNDPSDPSDDHHYQMTVEAGGTFILENSTFRTVDWATINPYLKLPLTIQGKALLSNSIVEYPGTLTVDNGVFYANDTTFEGLKDISSPYIADKDDNDDCPVMRFTNSHVVFADSKVMDYYEYDFSSPFEVSLTPSTIGALDTTAGQNVANLSADDDSVYSVKPGERMYIDSFADGLPSWASDSTYIFNPILHVTWDGNSSYNGTDSIYAGKDGSSLEDTGITPNSIPFIDQTWPIPMDSFRTVGDILNMDVSFIHNGDSGDMPFDRIWITANIIRTYNISVSGGDFHAINTYLDLDFRQRNSSASDGLKDYLFASNGADIRFYNVTVNEEETNGIHDDFVFFADPATTIYLYAWADVSTYDGNATDPTAVPYCNVKSEFFTTNDTWKDWIAENNTLHNGEPILDYLNRTSLRTIDVNNYNTTDANGTLMLPLLKTYITADDLNGQFVGNYLMTAHESIHGTNTTQHISFRPYPNITATDNSFTSNFTFSWSYPPRDLNISLSDISVSPSPVVRDDLASFDVTIHNTGGINITNPFWVELLVDGSSADIQKVDTMVERNGGTASVTLNWQTAFGDCGDHNITIAVDYNRTILDGNRSNNNVSFVLHVNALYDLSIDPTTIWWENTTYGGTYTDTNLTIHATVSNIGVGNISGDISVYFSVNGVDIGSSIINGLLSGASADVTVLYSTSVPGDYNVSVQVDAPSGINDDVPSNNLAYNTLNTDPVPDLTITAIGASDAIEGFDTVINATVENIGDTYANGTFVTTFYDGTTNIGSDTQNLNMTPGESNVFSIVWNAKRPADAYHDLHVDVSFTPSASNPPETLTDNNAMDGSIYVKKYVDLSISALDISVNPANPYTHEKITVSALVHNSGNESIGGFYVSIYQGEPVISASASTSAAYGIAQTSYTFSDENTRRIMIIYPGTWTGTIGVDDSSWSVSGTGNRTFDVTGKWIYISAQKGDASGEQLEVRIVDVGRNLISKEYISAMLPGGTESVSTDFYLNTSGDYVITVFVDSTNDISEVFENNNSALYDLNVSPTPDLIVSELSVPETAIETFNATLTAVVENIGEAYANGTTAAVFTDDTTGATIGTATYSGMILPGASINLSVIWVPSAPAGDHMISVHISFINATGEPLETVTDNNDATGGPVDVQLAYDLSISANDISWTPTNPMTREDITISAVIHNTGERDINTSFVVLFRINNIPYYVDVDGINAGDATTVSVVYNTTGSGYYTISVKVDSANSIPEYNETNNAASQTMYIGPRPEFSITDISIIGGIGSSSVVENHAVTITADIINTGSAGTGTLSVYFYDGDPDNGGVQIGYRAYTDPGQGWKSTASIDWTTEGVGEHSIYVMLVADTTPPEGNLADNLASTSLTVLPRPDLTVTSIQFLKNSEEINSTSECRDFEINVTIANTGGLLSDSRVNNFTLSLFNGMPMVGDWSNLIANISFENDSVELLDEGSLVSYIYTVKGFTLNPGTANIHAVIDSGNVVDESDESNNVLNKTLEILQMRIRVDLWTPDGLNAINMDDVQSIRVTGQLIDDTDGQPVTDIPLHVAIVDVETGESSSPVDARWIANRNNFEASVNTPGSPGTYMIRITGETPNGETMQIQQSDVHFTVERQVQESNMWWLIILIVVIVALALVGGSLYWLKSHYAGKYVECGNCGRMIPAGSDKCPYCNAVFDKETVKCSSCGAWIPADASECPKCGAKFLVSGKEIIDYESQMKQQYEAFVEKFRKQAKKEMGDEFSEKKFQQWWKTQKSYVTFEDWLKREEERKKTGGIICPTCGALNSKTDIVCHVCGSPLRKTKKKTEKADIDAASLSTIELPSLEKEKEEETAAEEPKKAEEEEKSSEAPAPETTAPVAPVKKKVVKKVVKKASSKTKETDAATAAAPAEEKKESGAAELPPELIVGMKEKGSEKKKPEEPAKQPPEEKPPMQKKVVKKVVKKKTIKK